MATISIRPAQIEDLKTLLTFEQGVIEAEKPLDPFLKTGKISYYNIKEMITAKNTHLLVAFAKNEIVGSGYVRIENSSEYYKNRENLLQDLLYEIFNPVFSWLIRTGNEKDYYFRTNKNSFQQGERITITGKPIRDQEIAVKGFIHISNNNTRINSKPIKYNFNTGLYTGQFWASQAGKLDYEIELIYADETLKVREGSIQVQESQIELNNVYLNSDPLIKLTELTKGSFYTWSNRFSILEILDKKSKDQKIRRRIVLHNNRWYFSSIILLLLSEWILRKRLGMM